MVAAGKSQVWRNLHKVNVGVVHNTKGKWSILSLWKGHRFVALQLRNYTSRYRIQSKRRMLEPRSASSGDMYALSIDWGVARFNRSTFARLVRRFFELH